MVATVRCYYNTGLTPSNCLDNSSLLDILGFTFKDFPDIAIKQDRGLIEIRLNAVYDDIKDADYCKINNNCYWITGITMVNDNVAVVQLLQDCLTTVGLYPLYRVNVISGWCTRRHVTDDAIYTNIIDEPFVPTREPVIETGTYIGYDDAGFYSIVLSTVDLLNIKDTAKAYKDNDDNSVLVPELPLVEGTLTTYKCHILNTEVDNPKEAYVALSNAYNAENESVCTGIGAVRELGVESCIGASYMLPKAWATIVERNGTILSITDRNKETISALKYKWGEYKNNKVYSGQFQKIVVFSLASGERCENRIEDIIDDAKTGIHWITYADTRYSGKPGCKPLWFKGHQNSAAMQAVYGSNWQQTPYTYSNASGELFIRAAKSNELERNFANSVGTAINAGMSTGLSTISAIAPDKPAFFKYSNQPLDGLYHNREFTPAGVAGAAGNIWSNFYSGMSSSMNLGFDRKALTSDFNRSLLSYEILFPQVPQMADYVGNIFYDLRYKLHDNDMMRFDNFLTQYGYAVDEPLTSECFVGREFFNFVKARDVSLKITDYPQYLIDGISKQLEAGVRIWHKAPNNGALTNNPIVTEVASNV